LGKALTGKTGGAGVSRDDFDGRVGAFRGLSYLHKCTGIRMLPPLPGGNTDIRILAADPAPQVNGGGVLRAVMARLDEVRPVRAEAFLLMHPVKLVQALLPDVQVGVAAEQ